MKKNKDKDIFDTETWCYQVINDPSQVLAHAFSTVGMDHLRGFIKKVLRYAETEKMYSKESPCQILLSMRVIRSLIKVAQALQETGKGPIDISERDVFDKNYYCSHYAAENEWTDFPRFLSMKEFCNPYVVFKKFFKYQLCDKWLRNWEETVDCALSENQGELGLDMISVYSHLAKLVEAAHLINVREVNHIGGLLKNRFIENS